MGADGTHGEEEHDVVIVGAGVAGLSCALECFDIQLDTVVFEADARPGGQLVEIGHTVRNVAAGSFRDGSALRGLVGGIRSDPGRLPPPVTVRYGRQPR